MRELWRKTFGMMREHPVLWAPYATAELLAFSLIKLFRLTLHPLLVWLSTTTTRSALGGTSETYDLDRGQHRAILLGGLLENGTHYVNACLLTLALVLTTVVAVEFLRGEIPVRASVVSALRPYTKRIFVFALKFCVVVWASTVVVLLPLSYLLSVILHPSRMVSSVSLGTGTILIMGSVAWIMAPVAIGLLRSQSAPLAEVWQKNVARHVALLAVLAMSILQFMDHRIDAHLTFSSRTEITAISALATLIINAPMAVLFTAFALLASGQLREDETRSGHQLRQIMKNLMPLHFSPGQEPDRKPGPAAEP